MKNQRMEEWEKARERKGEKAKRRASDWVLAR